MVVAAMINLRMIVIAMTAVTAVTAMLAMSVSVRMNGAGARAGAAGRGRCGGAGQGKQQETQPRHDRDGASRPAIQSKLTSKTVQHVPVLPEITPP